MGDTGHAGGIWVGNDVANESVTGVGGPVLLARTAQELGRGDVLAARYQIEALIGSGGSGRVLRAFDRVARELVALKILRPEYASDPVWAERFSRELRVGRQIQHHNVCRIFDIGEADGHRFLSMELATGGTVRGQIGPAALDRPLDDRIADARALIEGVAAVHAAGILHRDLKPENLLRMGDGRLVVSDFGLATDPGAGPATTIMIGTPRYMAQEVVMGEPATARSDVWALGVVMHEIFFGCRPDRSVVKRGVRQYTAPTVQSLRERRLAALCGRCTEDYPEARPASAAEVLREFDAAVQGRRLRRYASNRQIAWSIVALAAVATLGVVRARWTSQAIASSSGTSGSHGKNLVKATGAPSDWTRTGKKVATFDGPVHCVDLDKSRTKARVVWGQPRKAENLDIRTGVVTPTSLLSETFAVGCPQVSPDGTALLFEKAVEGAHQLFLSRNPDGSDGRFLSPGSAPRWLPNGQEFAFSLDARHAAVFSVSTRQIAVVADAGTVTSLIDDKAIDESGSRLALLYTSELLDTKIVIRALPGLELIRTIDVPTWTRSIRFDGVNRLLSTMVGDKGMRQLVSADLATGKLVNVAESLGADLQMFIPEAGLMTSRRRLMDLWRLENGEESRLTSDGQSVTGSLSGAGDLVVQRFLSDGREVIVLRRADGRETQVSDGPSDVTPTFFPDGKRWLFTRLSTGEIVECAVSDAKCRAIHQDPSIPSYAQPDPSSQQIAYITGLSNMRVRLLSLHTHVQRDLGATLGCPPAWASPTRIWVATAEGAEGRAWTEMDSDSGQPTGRTRFIRDERGQTDCSPPADVSASGGTRVVGKSTQSTTLWLTRGEELASTSTWSGVR